MLLNTAILNFLLSLITNCTFKLFWDKDNIARCIHIVRIYHPLLGIKLNINIQTMCLTYYKTYIIKGHVYVFDFIIYMYY